VVKIKGFCENGEIVVDLLLFSRYLKFCSVSQIKSFETNFKNLERDGIWDCRERKSLFQLSYDFSMLSKKRELYVMRRN
jgi:hypothetical protein